MILPSFEHIVNQYSQQIYQLIFKLVGNKEDAEDLTQNVFIKIFRNLKDFRAEAQLYSWIYRIAYNEAMDFHRKNKHILKKVDLEQVQSEASLENFDEDEALRLLRMAVAQLPARQSEVFVFRYFQEMSYEEIAELTGTGVSSLKTSYHLACKKIETFLKSTLNPQTQAASKEKHGK